MSYFHLFSITVGFVFYMYLNTSLNVESITAHSKVYLNGYTPQLSHPSPRYILFTIYA